MAAATQNHPVKTFTVRFNDSPPDQQEHEIARKVARSIGAEHTELVVESGLRSVLPRIAWHFGEPFADISAVPTFKIAEQARQHITVALTGDGGDESFAGYANVVASRRAQSVRALYPRLFRGPLHGAISLAAAVNGRAARVERWMNRWLEADTVNQYDLVNHWDVARRQRLYSDAGGRTDHALAQVYDVQRLCEFDVSDPEMHLFTDLRLRLPGDYLPKVDITSGMASLEVRSPFLDNDLVEYAARLPLDIRMRNGAQKALLRSLATQYLPEDVVREPKRGFAPPLTSWLRQDWRDLIEQHVGTRLAARDWVLDGDTIRQTVREHLSGAVDHTQRLWTLVTLEIWLEMFVDQTLTPEDSP
jgi:asparagine synthase (glutamine-hydrolysing)